MMNFEYEIKKLKQENACVLEALRDHDQRLKAIEKLVSELLAPANTESTEQPTA